MRNFFNKNRILIKEHGILYKVTMVMPYSEGGFSILVPYCKVQKGYICMHKADYSKHSYLVPLESMEKQFLTTKDVKLSIHRSGFAQFSGSGVLSGIDPKTNKIKGVGVWSAPLDNPITSRLTFGVIVYGLKEGFKQAHVNKDKKINEIIFEENDFYDRDCGKSIEYGYLIEGFFFSKREENYIRTENEKPVINLQSWNFEKTGATFKLRVILIKNSPGFIGLLPSKIKIGLSDLESLDPEIKCEAKLDPSFNKSKFGFSLSGPGGIIERTTDGRKIATVINCIYPEPWKDLKLPSLDYKEYTLERKEINKYRKSSKYN